MKWVVALVALAESRGCHCFNRDSFKINALCLRWWLGIQHRALFIMKVKYRFVMRDFEDSLMLNVMNEYGHNCERNGGCMHEFDRTQNDVISDML